MNRKDDYRDRVALAHVAIFIFKEEDENDQVIMTTD